MSRFALQVSVVLILTSLLAKLLVAMNSMLGAPETLLSTKQFFLLLASSAAVWIILRVSSKLKWSITNRVTLVKYILLLLNNWLCM